MNKSTTRSRTAHGVSVKVAWTALAAMLTLVPAGAADAMPRLTGTMTSVSGNITTHHARPMPRLLMSPNPRLYATPNPRLYATPNPRLYATPNPRLYATPNLRLR
jgi:hypothetical protein